MFLSAANSVPNAVSQQSKFVVYYKHGNAILELNKTCDKRKLVIIIKRQITLHIEYRIQATTV